MFFCGLISESILTVTEVYEYTSAVHLGAGVSSTCHVATKARLFLQKKALHPKTNLGLKI